MTVDTERVRRAVREILDASDLEPMTPDTKRRVEPDL